MDTKNVKVGTKVKLLGKHRVYDEYDNIEDWFDDFYHEEDVQQIKKQGYGVITDICVDGDIWVSNTINGNKWCFSISDLEPYDEEFFEESQENKTPKEWLLTPMITFTSRNGFHCITLGNCTSYVIETGEVWDNELDENYDEDLQCVNIGDSRFDIMSITYEGKVVWKRKEYITLTDAIKTGKNIKHKDWDDFIYPTNVMLLLSYKADELINLFTDKVWEVE